MSATEALLAQQRQRQADLLTPEGKAELQARVERIGARVCTTARKGAVARVARANAPAARIHWLRVEAEAVTAAAEGVAPCKRGCAHCCHIAVSLADAEARVIAKQIGRKLSKPPARAVAKRAVSEVEARERRAAEVRRWVGVPCTFLGPDGACTIYEHRPLICRYVINVDRDDLLCRHVPIDSALPEVPYLDMALSQELSSAALLPFTTVVADIREWFPALGDRR